MWRYILLLLIYALAAGASPAQERNPGPQPRVVDPGDASRPPSDAIPLFNGKDMSGWTTKDGKPAKCAVANGVMTCVTGAGDIYHNVPFRDAQIHVEFAIPSMPAQHGQARGNSGVFLQGCYEVQVLDSYRNPTYANGSAGAFYALSEPLVNASRPPERWQSYDIVFHPPRCDAQKKITAPGSISILHNGVLVQDHFEFEKPTPGCELKSLCDAGPLRLQDHNGPNAPVTPMKFRNLWMRPLEGKK